MSKQYQRRSHTKSRAGCSQCKVRRIKCDERHPQCGYCERRGAVCDFSRFETSPPSTITSPTNLTDGSESSPSNYALSWGNPSALSSAIFYQMHTSNIGGSPPELLDFELLYHYLMVTAPDMGGNGSGPSHLDIWQKEIPQLAFSNDFLMQGILALAALHLAHLVPVRRAELSLKASALQEIGLASFQEALQHLNESNCHVLFSFSTLLIPICFAVISADATIGDVEIDPFRWVWLLRGSFLILQSHRERLLSSFLKPLLAYEERPVPAEVHDMPDASHITGLFKLAETVEDQEASQACILATHSLMGTFMQMNQLQKRQEGKVLALLFWAAQQSPKFNDLITERHPEAMVILAHFCVLIHRSAHQSLPRPYEPGYEWFLFGCARKILDAIRATLPEKYHATLAWPESAIPLNTTTP